MSTLDRPLTKLETSVFSQNVYRALGVKTVGELIALGEARYYEFAVGMEEEGSRFAAMSLKETNELLGGLGVRFSQPA